MLSVQANVTYSSVWSSNRPSFGTLTELNASHIKMLWKGHMHNYWPPGKPARNAWCRQNARICACLINIKSKHHDFWTGCNRLVYSSLSRPQNIAKTFFLGNTFVQCVFTVPPTLHFLPYISRTRAYARVSVQSRIIPPFLSVPSLADDGTCETWGIWTNNISSPP